MPRASSTGAPRRRPDKDADRAGATIIPLGPDDTHGAPGSRARGVAATPAPSAAVRRATIDEWGRDQRFLDVLSPLAHLRWDVSVGGAHHLPHHGALIIINTRRLALTPVSTALALSEELDRPVRFVGRPDVVPFGPFLRRIGGLLAQPAEIAGALRAGELVVLGASGTGNPRHAGTIDPNLVAPAIREQVPVHVGATLSSMIGRQARVEVVGALRAGRKRRGPLAEVELAEQAQRRLQDLLDELGGTRTGVPGLGWLGEG